MLRRIVGNLHLLEHESFTAAAQHKATEVRTVSQVLAPVLQSMLTLVDTVPGPPRCMVEDVLQTVLPLVAPLATERSIRVVPYAMPLLVLSLPLGEAQYVFLHLIINRIEAIPPHANAEHTLWINIVAWDATVVITVRDTGPGVPPANRAHIFDPLLAMQSATAGSGSGLPTVRSILQRAGGNIALTDTRPGHTTFTAWLPRLTPDALLSDVLPPNASLSGNHSLD